MTEFLSHAATLTVLIFATTSMGSVGLRYTPLEILEPLRDLRGVLLALAANFIVVPLLAFVILRFVALERPYAIGLVLIASAAGAPFVIPLTKMAGGDVAFSSGLLVLLLTASIGYTPVIVPCLAPEAEVSTWSIAKPLVMTMLLPLSLGLLVKALAPGSRRVRPLLGMVTNVALVLLVVLTFALNLHTLLGVFGTGAILSSLLLVAGAFVSGWVMGSFGEHLRDEMALGTAQRNFAAAMVVSTESFNEPGILVMVVVASVVTMALLFPAAKLLNRHLAGAAKVPG